MRIHALIRLALGAPLPFALAVALTGRSAFAGSPVKIYRGRPGLQIPGLRIFAKPELSEKVKGEDVEEYLVINGLYPSKENSLISGRTVLKRNSRGRFKIKMKLTGPRKTVLLAAVAPDGTVKMERIKILYPGFRRRRMVRWGFSGGIGLSYVSYSQSATDDIRSVSLQEMGITGKVSFDYHIVPRRWDLGISMYATALVPYARLNEQYYPQIGESAPSGSIRFLGANARVGYTLPFINNPWSLTLMGGVYYTTTFCSVSPSYPFGFENLMGPQLFPVLRRSLANGNSLSMYLKYSPVSSGGFSVYSLSSREVAAGATYSIRHGKHFIPISLDVANLQTNIEDDVVDPISGNTLVEYSHINSTSVSLSIGYTL